MVSSLPPSIRSIEELLAMAQAMEQAAAQRYRDLAAGMRLRGAEHLAALFDFLATIEEKHAAAVARRAAGAPGRPPTVEGGVRDVPETFDEEEGSSRLLTPPGQSNSAARSCRSVGP